jgi:hypothetical protein
MRVTHGLHHCAHALTMHMRVWAATPSPCPPRPPSAQLMQHSMASPGGHEDLPPEATATGAHGEAWVSSLGAYRDGVRHARKTEEEAQEARDAAIALSLGASPSGRYDAAAAGGGGFTDLRQAQATSGGAPLYGGSMQPLDLRALVRHQFNRRATTILLWLLCAAHLGRARQYTARTAPAQPPHSPWYSGQRKGGCAHSTQWVRNTPRLW